MKAPIEPFFTRQAVDVHILRHELSDPFLAGNKAFKLKYNIAKMRDLGLNTLLTFGGAHSNHIAAVAAAGYQQHFKTIGVIRGDELHPGSNSTLRAAHEHGMHLHFVTREQYQDRAEKYFADALQQQFGGFYLVPEGGANYLGVMGSMEMIDERAHSYNGIVCSAGTGTMAAGFALALKGRVPLHVYSAVAGIDWEEKMYQAMMQVLWDEEAVRDLLESVTVFSDVLGGRFRPASGPLAEDIDRLERESGILLDPVYTGKAALAMQQNIDAGRYGEGSRWLFVHSGGLQGRPNTSREFHEDYIRKNGGT